MTKRKRSPGETGIALVVVLMLLVVLSMAAVTLTKSLVTTVRQQATAKAETQAFYASDAAAWTGRTWMKALKLLAPPSRVNLTQITSPSDPNYYLVRNWGGLGDSNTTAATNFVSAPRDGSMGIPGSGYWYRVRIDPNGIVNPTRAAGEEAGVLVTYTYYVESAALCAEAIQRVNVRLTQTYNLSPYGGG